jgi:hypothetical protein
MRYRLTYDYSSTLAVLKLVSLAAVALPLVLLSLSLEPSRAQIQDILSM